MNRVFTDKEHCLHRLKMSLTVKLALLVVLPHIVMRCVDAYPGGPPPSACESMFPSGHGVPAQTTSSPVTFNMSSGLSFNSGDYIPVTLRTTDSNSFKGMFVQARLKSDNTQIVGSFHSGSLPSGVKTMTCGGIDKGAVSHSSSADKSSVTVYWYAKDVTADVIFRATVVRQKEVFWVEVDSPDLMYSTSSSDFSPDEPNASGTATRNSAASSVLVLIATLFAALYM